MPGSTQSRVLDPATRAELQAAARRAVQQNPPRFSDDQLDQLRMLFRPATPQTRRRAA